ncbi:cadherin-10-like protein [Lates japonicus]|uniref:Cadherin-10-like protein n=1 Tax=Lates japonicus TaxID=270547 RepID=A0AAD3RNE9_LATJO|nr:cadherin-10-like protein [Lates japonicus]
MRLSYWASYGFVLASLDACLWRYTSSDYQYIGKLQSDQDHGNGLVKYVLSGEGAGTIFVIDENNGDLHATRRLDREEKAFYILRATVVNKRTGQKLEPETEFTVKLHDINDNEPQFSKELYTGSVPERSLIGTSVIQIQAMKGQVQPSPGAGTVGSCQQVLDGSGGWKRGGVLARGGG